MMKQLFFAIFVSFLLLFSMLSSAQAPVLTSWVSASLNETVVQFRMHDRSINNGYALCEVSFDMSAARCALTSEVSITIYENDGTSTNGTQRYSTTFDPGPGTVGVSTSETTRIQIVSTETTEPLYARVNVVGVLPADDFELVTPDCITSIVTSDSYDPNDDYTSANTIASGTTHEGLVVNNDADYFELTLTASNRHLIVSMDYLNDYRTTLANLDLDLFLISGNGTTLFSSTSSATSTSAPITESLNEIPDPGTYYICVRPKSVDPNRNFYKLTWNTDATPSYQISGNIRDEGANDISGVMMNGLPGDPLSNVDGYYGVAVEHGWSGTVTPGLAGYTFDPASISYTDVEEAHLSETYTAFLTNPVISGRITDGEGAGEEGVTLGGFPETVISDANGYYSGTVSYNWTGTITPLAEGLAFTPETRVYSPVQINITDQDYVSDVGSVTISGTVTMEGNSNPLVGVSMAGSPGPALTDSEGAYSFDVLYGSSFTISPELEGYSFTPADFVFTNVTSPSTVLFSATLNTYTISGKVQTSGGSALSGVGMTGLPGDPLSDASGNYLASVDHGRSAEEIPVLAGYTFDPVSTSYSSVATSTSQDYTANPNIYMIDGHVLDTGGIALSGVNMNGLPGDPTTDVEGYYTASVEYGTVITVTPALEGYSFSPSFTDYNPVDDDDTTDYTGTRDPYLTISESMLSLGQEAGANKQVNLSSNVNWTVSCPESWITLAPELGTGDGAITITANTENISTESRSATVTITGDTITRSIEVTQSGSGPFLETSMNLLTLASTAGASGSFGIVSNIAWNVSEAADWLTVTPASGSNDGVITLTALTQNEMVESRSATVTVSGENIAHLINVTQSGSAARLEVSPLTVAVDSEAGSYINVNITSNVDWNVSKDMWWLVVSPQFGFGDGMVTLLADQANPDITERIAIVTIAGDTMVRQVVLTQAAAPEPTGMSNPHEEFGLNVYPNPTAADRVFVKTNIFLDDQVLLRILDITGKVLHERQLPRLLPGEPVELDLTSYPGGPYLVLICSTHINKVFKIMKYNGK